MIVRPRVRIGSSLLLTAPLLALFATAEQLPADSPFVPPAGNAPKTDSAAAAYEFVGMTRVGSETLLSIQRKSDSRSVWIPLGGTVAEITAVSYDPSREEAVIRTGPQVLTLRMRNAPVQPSSSASTGGNPAPASVPPALTQAPAAVPTKPLTTQEEKEMEARMLVSDLLEIGLQQRKAYEAAQREAAARAAVQPAGKKEKSPPALPAGGPAPAQTPAQKK